MNNLTQEKAQAVIARARFARIGHVFYPDRQNNGRYVVKVNASQKAWEQIASSR